MGLKELEKRLEQEPDNLGLRVIVAGAMRDAGRHTDASALYRSVALAYRAQGRLQQAVMVCKSALEQAPDDARIRELLAVLTASPEADDSGVALPDPPSIPPRRAATAAPAPTALPRSRAPSSLPLQPPDPTPIPAHARTRSPSGPPMRPSDATPLPAAMPYHVHDPTSSLLRIALSELPMSEGADTRPGSEAGDRPSVDGLASAARRITRTLTGDIDVAAELDTRERVRLEPEEAARLSEPPPTVPITRVDGSLRDSVVDVASDVDEDATTPVPLRARDSDEELTNPRDAVMEKPRPIDSILFTSLPLERRALALARFYKRSVKKSATVIRQGATDHPLVLVVTGRLAVRAERADGSIAMLEAIGENEFVGESSLLTRTPAEANVVAASDAELLLLSPHDFFEIAGAFPAWWAHLKAHADRRTRDHERRR